MKRSFVLVHGSWHGSAIWERIASKLVAAGHSVVATDRPGRGLNALFPQSYVQQPKSLANLTQEFSPVGDITLDQDVNSVLASVTAALEGGSGPVILVGHSSAGFAITPVAEKVPELIGDIVYLAGMMNAAGVTPSQDLFSADNNFNKLLVPLLSADPKVVGALRLDWKTGDPTLFAGLQNAFYNDVDLTTFRAVANLLTPDDPCQPFSSSTEKTAERWGSVRRSYIRTGLDHVILPALQDRWIAQADALTPFNLTNVYRVNSSHSPFISQPDKIVEFLLEIANHR